MNQENSNQNEDNKQSITDVLKPQHVTEVLETINRYINQKEKIDIEKLKKIHTYNIVSRYLQLGFLTAIFLVLSILTYNNTISETIFATLISSIIGYLVGSNRTANGNK